MRWFCFLLLPFLLQAEDARLAINSDRPAISAAEALARRYRIPVSRSVLRRLIRVTPGRYYYLQRCSTVVPGCFISVMALD